MGLLWRYARLARNIPATARILSSMRRNGERKVVTMVKETGDGKERCEKEL